MKFQHEECFEEKMEHTACALQEIVAQAQFGLLLLRAFPHRPAKSGIAFGLLCANTESALRVQFYSSGH